MNDNKQVVGPIGPKFDPIGPKFDPIGPKLAPIGPNQLPLDQELKQSAISSGLARLNFIPESNLSTLYLANGVLPIGFDTEYVTYTDNDGRELPDCVIAQLAIKGNYPLFKHPELIHNQFNLGYTSLVFLPPKNKLLGVEFLKWLEGLILALLTHIGLSEQKLTVELVTFYSNAEMSLIIPNKDYAKKLVLCQNHNKFRPTPIQSTGNLINMGITLPENITLNLKDARLISASKSLKELGASLGFEKGDCDFNKHDARWYLENDKNNFLNYGARDAIIPLMWTFNYHNTLREIGVGLANKGIITEKSCLKLQNKIFSTAASGTDYLMHALLECEGKVKRHLELVRYLEYEVMPSKFFSLNKGGLNKSSHGFSPQILKNLDSYDISSAYLTAIKNLKFPLVNPTHDRIFNDGVGKWWDVKNLGSYLDKLPVSFVIFSEINIPESTPEHKRILNLYDRDGECVTALDNSTISQCVTGVELQALALVAPKTKIKVVRIFGWGKKVLKNPDNYICYEQLFTELQEYRKEFKKVFGDKSPQQNVAKLLGNGGVGKLAQNKEGFNSKHLINCLKNDGDVNSLIKESFRSKTFNPLFFNLITATVRVTTGLSYALSDGVMAVTDSVACPTGKFCDSRTIAEMVKNKKISGVRYENLVKCLSWFEWELEQENNTLQIYKERDYAWLDFENDSDRDHYAEQIVKGEATSDDLKNCHITKIAKRGVSSKP